MKKKFEIHFYNGDAHENQIAFVMAYDQLEAGAKFEAEAENEAYGDDFWIIAIQDPEFPVSKDEFQKDYAAKFKKFMSLSMNCPEARELAAEMGNAGDIFPGWVEAIENGEYAMAGGQK